MTTKHKRKPKMEEGEIGTPRNPAVTEHKSNPKNERNTQIKTRRPKLECGPHSTTE
jgi:hypothetical protein